MRLNWNIAVGLQILLENNGNLTFEEIAKKGENSKFLKGWLNRVKDFYV